MLATFHEPDGESDATLAREYMDGCDLALLTEILTDGQRFLNQYELPMSLIRGTANRHLRTEAEQRQWLQTLLDRVQAELEARKAGLGSKRL